MYKKLLIFPYVHIRIHIPANVDSSYFLQPQFHLADRKHCIIWGHTKGKSVKKRKPSICYAGVSITIQKQVFCFSAIPLPGCFTENNVHWYHTQKIVYAYTTTKAKTKQKTNGSDQGRL